MQYNIKEKVDMLMTILDDKLNMQTVASLQVNIGKNKVYKSMEIFIEKSMQMTQGKLMPLFNGVCARDLQAIQILQPIFKAKSGSEFIAMYSLTHAKYKAGGQQSALKILMTDFKLSLFDIINAELEQSLSDYAGTVLLNHLAASLIVIMTEYMEITNSKK